MIADFFSVRSAFCIFAIAVAIYRAVLRFQEHRLIERLGGYAPSVKGWLPFSESTGKRDARLNRLTPNVKMSTCESVCPSIHH